MDIFEAIKKRHSYRGPFLETLPSERDLKKIVEAGLLAPSGKNMQTTDFVIITDSEICEKINKLHETNKALQSAKAFIACISDKNPKACFFDMEFTTEDAAAATENMLLSITALGYASVWIDGWLKVDDNGKKIEEFINLPKDKTLRILLPVGKPKKQHHQPEKKSFPERVFFNSYQA